jgi:RNA polymerase sigma-70 factor (ECF subfamily)
MNDAQILDLYERRDESAIGETQERYGAYCRAIAMNILDNREDSEEVVSDTYLRVWNAIPPERPAVFSTYIGRIVRNLSLNRLKANRAAKRGGQSGAAELLFSELEACIPAARTVESEVDSRALGEAIDSFLATLKKDDRAYFLCRYWYSRPVSLIARQFGVSEGKVSMSLSRARKKLKVYLEREEF